MESNAELRDAWDFIEHTGANLFLTGKAGTGKTTFLKKLREKSFKRMVVLAPTGIAAINAGGVTLHSFFQLPLSPYLPGTTMAKSGDRRFMFGSVKRNIIRTLDLLVIDEISMVRADLLDAVDSVMRRYRDHDKPFGGAQLLMIGDLQQLSPVVKDDEWDLLKNVYATPYFFSSKALNSAGYHTIELKTVFRQQDLDFVRLLNSIRDNKADDNTLELLNKRFIPGFKPDKGSDYIRLTTHNRPAQMINEEELGKLSSPKHVFRAEVEGNFPEASYPADLSLVLKQGAQVMFIKNDPERRFFNGMIGEVVSVSDENITVKGKSGGEPFDVERAEWTNSKYTIDKSSNEIKETIEGVFRQYPLRLAWAITIHKSQGLTFERAIIDVSNSFAHGQTYVALSRCKTLEGIVLTAPLRREAIISDAMLDGYIREINQMKPSEDTIPLLRKAYQLQILDEMFDFASLQAAFSALLRTIDEFFYRRYPKLLDAYKKSALMFTSIRDVAMKFRCQYVRMLDASSDLSDAALQGRISKASGYFAGVLKPFADLLLKTNISSDNKAAKKRLDDRLSDFKDVLSLKIKLFDRFKAENCVFGVETYLRLKANITLSSDEENMPNAHKTRNRRKPVEREPKIPSKDITLEMYNKGMDAWQIAETRGLALSTIYTHLYSFVGEGKLAVRDFVPTEYINEIESFMASHPDEISLSAIKSSVNQEISYDEIKLVLSALESKDVGNKSDSNDELPY